MEKDFYNLCEYVKNNTVDDMIFNGLLKFFKIHENYKNKYNLIELKQKFDSEIFKELPSNIDYFEKCISDIKKNLAEYKLVFKMLYDQKSKETYLNVLKAKVYVSLEYIELAYTDEEMYFNHSIFDFKKNEVYIDCGGYNGDTIFQFMKHCIEFSKIYVYEAMPLFAEKLREKLAYFITESSVIVRQKAVYSKDEKLKFSKENCTGDSKVSDTGNLIVQGCSLDNDIKEHISFIKMDIEGSEKEAILGAKGHIKNDNPKMAICIYHLEDDFWKIPKLIYDINTNYEFIIRHHSLEVFSETVLYCIPKNKIVLKDSSNNEKIKNILKRYENILLNINICLDEDLNNNISRINDRKWYLQQLRNYKTSLEEMKKWISELEQGKEWLENQYKTLTKEKEDMKKWIDELEQGKIWIEEQWKVENERRNEVEEGIENLENDKNKLQYKINKIKEDRLIMSIVKLKKYNL